MIFVNLIKIYNIRDREFRVASISFHIVMNIKQSEIDVNDPTAVKSSRADFYVDDNRVVGQWGLVSSTTILKVVFIAQLQPDYELFGWSL